MLREALPRLVDAQSLMLRALDILDQLDPQAAACLSLALDRAGLTPPSPPEDFLLEP